MKTMDNFGVKKETAYKICSLSGDRYLLYSEYWKKADYYRMFGYKVVEVTELPQELKFMQHIDNGKVTDIPNLSFVEQLRQVPAVEVGTIGEVRFGSRVFRLKAVKVTSIRVVWEQMD